MIQISQIKLPCGTNRSILNNKIRSILHLNADEDFSWKISRHSVDARKKPDLYDVYSVTVELKKGRGWEQNLVRRRKNRNIIYKEKKEYHPVKTAKGAPELKYRPVVIGFGPAGMFCALLLAEAGYRPLVLERGSSMEERIRDVENFWSEGTLNPESNIQFGEGGAGTFSDGKLTTNVRDAAGRNERVAQILIRAGAPEDIAYENLPHIGTDVLRKVVVNIRKRIQDLGGEIRFHSKAADFLTEDGRITGIKVESEAKSYVVKADRVVLAPGHSSRDTIRTLYKEKLPMSQKAFAVGFRVTHSQRLLNEHQYGISDPEELKRLHLPAVSYKVTAHPASGRGVYSFCMCPGGYVVNASSERGRLAVNGMSDYARDSRRANSAIVMTVNEKDFGSKEVLAGMKFQEKLEEKAYDIAKGRIPLETYEEFKTKKVFPVQDLSREEAEQFCVKGLACHASLNGLLPKGLEDDFIAGMESFEHKISGFAGSDAMVCGLESRTSSPVRILRDEGYESGIRGLYPCGEGAGYAGGITSAAIDGMKIAEEIISHFGPAKIAVQGKSES